MNKSIVFASVLTAFALGGACMWAWQHYQTPEATELQAAAALPAPDMVPPQPLAALADPISAMEEMRKQMEAFFNQDDFFNQAGMSGNFGSWFNTAHGAFGTKIQEGEDDQSVFFKLKVGDQDVSDVDVTVENGYVSISAELSNQSSNAYSRSSVSESFPVPTGVDPDSAKIDKEDDSIVIRFAKVS